MDFKSFFENQKPTGPYKQKKTETLVPVANIFKNSTDHVVRKIENFIFSPSKEKYDMYYFLFTPYTVSYDRREDSWGIGFSAKVDSYLSKSLPKTIEQSIENFKSDYKNNDLPHPPSFYDNLRDFKLVFYYNKNFYVTKLENDNSTSYKLIRKKDFTSLSELLQTYEEVFDIMKDTSKVNVSFQGPIYYIKQNEDEETGSGGGPLTNYFSDISKNWNQIKHNLKMMRKGL